MDQHRIDSHKLFFHPERVVDWSHGKLVYPIYVEIAPAGACNHRCTFCAVDYIGYVVRFLDADVLKARLTEMGRLGVKSVMYAGEGEPLLHKRLAEIIVHAKAAGIDNAITTNAVALTDRFAHEALPATSWIKASVNAGTREDYARIHQTEGKDWDRVWTNLANAVDVRATLKAPCTLGAQMLLLPDNVDGAVELGRRCKDAGLDYLVIKPYSHHLMSLTRQYEGIDYHPYLHLADELEKLNDDRFHVVFRRHTMLKLADPDRHYQKCMATPHFWAYIMAHGDLYGCSAYLLDPRFLYGNILKQTFEEIWTGELRSRSQQYVEQKLDITECRKNCRMDEVNRYLWELKHPGAHVNFI
jgi:radical SAM protein with 4Fe4S-binding SPASM domain